MIHTLHRYACYLVLIFFTASCPASSNSGRLLGGNPNYGTHMAALLTAVLHTTGPVLEMGCGDYSTPLLHALCKPTKRLIVSADCDQNWLNRFRYMENNLHQFIYVDLNKRTIKIKYKKRVIQKVIYDHIEKWNAIGTEQRWGVVLIDHDPFDRRAVDIMRLRSNADIIVVHDTQDPSYGYEPVLAQFKYRYTYNQYAVTTTLVSDVVDVATLFDT